ncbi:MAG TPA: 4-hydroxyphenylacetate 3-hydroxylase N-terminal domain-containing protein [Candidatus Binatia bacterium]|nr:4-hydroxyphenylacetate 3-hydroxylase N-terminal domain-containing protein [Candidatus Binatia bacterium]
MPVRRGADYINGLRDGREVWHAGRRITDVTTHAGFSGTIKTLADLYDQQHTPEYRDIMTLDYQGERISYSYLPPKNSQELLLKRRNIEFWAQQTFGQMGRYPEFVAELIVGLLDWTHVIEKTNSQWAENARAYHRYVSRNDLCLTHALTDQYYDRTKPVSKQSDPDLILRVVGETKDGPVIRGLRTLATLAPISDEVIVYPNRPREPDEADYATAFAIPLNTSGLKIICRDLYAEHADPERQPLTTRFDEVDAALIFDDVVVPWDRVFVYKDPKLLSGIMYIHTWGQYSTMLRLIVKLEAFLGVAQLLTQYAGRNKSAPSQLLLSSLMQDIEILRSCIQVSESKGYRAGGGTWAPLLSPAYRVHSIEASDRAERTMEGLLTSTLMLSGGASDLDNPQIGPLIDRYFRGGAPNTKEHLRLMAVAADMVMTPFGKRSQLYERLQSGEVDRMRQRLYGQYQDPAPAQRMMKFVKNMDNDR